jgi:hypothetical protein
LGFPVAPLMRWMPPRSTAAMRLRASCLPVVQAGLSLSLGSAMSCRHREGAPAKCGTGSFAGAGTNFYWVLGFWGISNLLFRALLISRVFCSSSPDNTPTGRCSTTADVEWSPYWSSVRSARALRYSRALAAAAAAEFPASVAGFLAAARPQAPAAARPQAPEGDGWFWTEAAELTGRK